MKRSMSFLTIGLLFCVLIQTNLSAQQESPASPKTGEKEKHKPEKQNQEKPDVESLKGFDSNPRSELETLKSIQKKMDEVSKLLAQNNTGKKSRTLQKRIIAEFESLLQKQADPNSQSNAQQEQSQSSAKSKPENTNEQPQDSSQAGKQSKTDQNNTSGKAVDFKPSDLNLDSYKNAIWGHLPPRLRATMSSVEFEKFVPKYDRLIRRYYERLAEESNK